MSARLVCTYAGFESESELLEGLYKRAMQGKVIGTDLRATDDGMLCYWTHECKAPWQSQEWKSQMLASLRPNQYLRMIENRWVTTESSFIELAKWDACVDSKSDPSSRSRGSQSGSALMRATNMTLLPSSRAHTTAARSAFVL